MASPNTFDFPHFPPPPNHPSPPPHIRPPPPHILPPPPPLPPNHPSPPPHIRPPPPPYILPPPPPSPSPDNHTTIIIVVFVSFGGLLFLAFLAFGLCCLIKKRKKRVEEAEVVHVDEHLKVKEAIVEGAHGAQSVVLEIDDDVHVDKVIRKEEKLGHGRSSSVSDHHHL